MKKMFYLMFAFAQVFIATAYSEPMESHMNYNVILVHGAGGSETGLDCVNIEYMDAMRGKKDSEGYFEIIGGYGASIDIDFDFDLFDRGLEASVLSKKRESSALTDR